ncbi:MAG: dihydrofolate reductase family protein, partial [Gaiellaceae bacterium]
RAVRSFQGAGPAMLLPVNAERQREIPAGIASDHPHEPPDGKRKEPMAKVIIGMTTSLDGFVADQNGSAARLYPDLAALRGTAYMNAAIAETGAVLMGRRTFEMGDPDSYVGSYEFQVPIFVLTHEPPQVAPKQDEHLTFTFVTDGVESAVAQATAAAGNKAVQVVGGVNVTEQLLQAGLVDELRVDVMPVLLGAGLRFLDNAALERVQLEKVGVQEVAARTSLGFRVKK